MLARLKIVLPFSVQIPEGEHFTVYKYEDEGYEVRVCPPKERSKGPADSTTVDQIEIDGRKALSSNVLRIDFRKEQFDRREDTELDPCPEFIERTVNSFLVRLRYVTRAAKVRTVNFVKSDWRLQYLNDDETELKREDGFIRARVMGTVSLRVIPLTKEVWSSIHDLSPDFEPPPWDDLLLDASDALPEVGPSLVLAATALEVFVARILDELAKRSTIPSDLWTWLNNREWWFRDPTTEEQFDELLKFLLTYSLKEDQQLWEAFKHIKSARNSFVHDGTARVGKVVVTNEHARRLVDSAVEIIQAVRQRLPEDIKWKQYQHQHKVTGCLD